MNSVIEVDMPVAVYKLVDGQFACTHEAVRISRRKDMSPFMPPLYSVECSNPDCSPEAEQASLVNDCWQ